MDTTIRWSHTQHMQRSAARLMLKCIKLKARRALARAHNSDNESKQLLDAGMVSGRHSCKVFISTMAYVAEK